MNPNTLSMSKAVRMLALNILDKMAQPQPRRSYWGFEFSPEGVFEHTSPIQNYFKINNFGPETLSLNGDCEEHLIQLGRAIAQISMWNLQRPDDNGAAKAYLLEHRYTGRVMMAQYRKDSGLATVYEQGDSGRFEIYGQSYLMWQRIPKSEGVAWSKFHLIGWLLAHPDMKINIGGNDPDEIEAHIEDGYRREVWMLSGYAPSAYPCHTHMEKWAEGTVGL